MLRQIVPVGGSYVWFLLLTCAVLASTVGKFFLKNVQQVWFSSAKKGKNLEQCMPLGDMMPFATDELASFLIDSL